ncbi:hypothetical protein MNBD_BACTEROID01-2077, partial [hydrothermal vent metagenome]
LWLGKGLYFRETNIDQMFSVLALSYLADKKK